MLRCVLFGGFIVFACCGMFRLPLDLDLSSKVTEYGASDHVSAELVKEWLIEAIRQRDPDMSKQREMIEHFFTESVGTGRLAVSTLQEKI